MDLPQRGASRSASGSTLVPFALALLVIILFWALVPSGSAAPPVAPAAPAAGFDPDTGFWIELTAVTVVTCLAGVLFHWRATKG
jgi:hypothetical protein